MSVKNLTTPLAISFVSVGRIIEHGGRLGLRNGQGSGLIKLFLRISPAPLRSRNVTAKRFEIHRARTLRSQVGVEKGEVSDLVVSVIVDVLCHVRVEVGQRGSVDWTATATWYFSVLDAPEFVVLHPKVALEDFGCSREPEKSGVVRGEATTGEDS